MADVNPRSLGRNSIYGLAAQVWRIGSRIVLTPLIIARVGLEGYGVWTLLFTLCAYASVVDVNFGVAYAKFTAQYEARREHHRLAQILGSGMASVGFIGAVILLVIWLGRVPILSVLGVPQAMLPEALRALLVVAICVLMQMSAGCVFQVLAGLQRLDLQYKTRVFGSAVEFLVSLILLIRGWGLFGLAVGFFSGQVVALATARALCWRLCPELHISPFQATRWGLRQVMSLGGRFQLLAAVQMILQQGIRMAISGLAGVATLAIYEIAHKLLSLGGAVGGAVIAPLMPAFANLHAAEQRARLQSLHSRASRIVSAACLGGLSFVAVFADRIIFLWTANDYPLAAWTVRWMALAVYVVQLTGVGTASLRGRGTIRLELAYSLICTLLLGVLFVPAFLLWGYKGVIAAITASVITGSAWFIVMFARRESLRLAKYLRDTVLRPVLVIGAIMALVAVVQSYVDLSPALGGGRLSTALELAIWSAICIPACLVPTWYLVLVDSDRAALASFLPRWTGTAIRRVLWVDGTPRPMRRDWAASTRSSAGLREAARILDK